MDRRFCYSGSNKILHNFVMDIKSYRDLANKAATDISNHVPRYIAVSESLNLLGDSDEVPDYVQIRAVRRDATPEKIVLYRIPFLELNLSKIDLTPFIAQKIVKLLNA